MTHTQEPLHETYLRGRAEYRSESRIFLDREGYQSANLLWPSEHYGDRRLPLHGRSYFDEILPSAQVLAAFSSTAASGCSTRRPVRTRNCILPGEPSHRDGDRGCLVQT